MDSKNTINSLSFLDDWVKIKVAYSLNKASNTDINLKKIEETLVCFKNILRERQKINKEESTEFNYFRFFNLNETKHSELLAFLLNPYEQHGQGMLFLKLFLNKLGVIENEKTKWYVTAEKERIDILIKCYNPETVIILENKSNGAIDQENQLYRYWHKHIYKVDKSQDFNSEDVKIRYQIVYLAPNRNKIPSNNSLTRPVSLEKENPNETILTIPTMLLFSEIASCLEPAIELLHEKNFRLKEYLKQYFETLKNIN